MRESRQRQQLVLADPNVAAFVEQCGIVEKPAPKPHRISVLLQCVDLDDLIRQIIEIEHMFGERITMRTPRQTGHGWAAKGSIAA